MLSMVITAETLRQRWSVSVRDDWVQETLRSLHSKGPGFSGLSEQQQAEQLFGKFLFADLNIVGAQALPPNVKVREGVTSFICIIWFAQWTILCAPLPNLFGFWRQRLSHCLARTRRVFVSHS